MGVLRGAWKPREWASDSTAWMVTSMKGWGPDARFSQALQNSLYTRWSSNTAWASDTGAASLTLQRLSKVAAELPRAFRKDDGAGLVGRREDCRKTLAKWLLMPYFVHFLPNAGHFFKRSCILLPWPALPQ